MIYMDLILSLTPPPPIKSADFWHAPYYLKLMMIIAFHTLKQLKKRRGERKRLQ